MKTIETDPELSAAFDHFKPHSNAVFATGRILNGQWLQDNCQEWAEYGTVNIPSANRNMFVIILLTKAMLKKSTLQREISMEILIRFNN